MEEDRPELMLDFIFDYAELIKARFKKLRIATDAVAPRDLIVSHENFERRLTDARPRRVEKSREFKCPTDHDHGLGLLMQAIMRGVSLLPYMSKGITNADFDDDMFNDWGVYHFHLGIKPDPNDQRFIDRTGPIAYAIVTDTTVYCIDVMEHGRGVKHAWTSQRIMQIAYDNWPELLRRSHLSGLTGGPPLTDDKLRIARSKNCTAAIVLRDGEVLIGPGGGLVSNGMGMRTIMNAHNKLDALGQFEENVRQALPEMVVQLRQRGMQVPQRLSMKLTLVDGLPFASCEDPPFRIPLTPQGSAAVAERQAGAST